MRDVTSVDDERLLVGPQTLDDAGVVLLGGVEGAPALVQTVDFFPPIVDDPYFYGAIAAANALSDVYAMGGRPLSALNLAGFPEDLSPESVREILRGGFEKIRESGAVVAGGHTVSSAEPLFGFAVTGLVDPDAVIKNDGARPGDVLYLTKPLGMGVVTTAAKFKKTDEGTIERAARQMAELNDRAGDAMCLVGAHACTDITGFGLMGHARNIAVASVVTLRFDLASLPIFEGAFALAERGLFSGGRARGMTALAEFVRVAAGLDATRVGLAFDSETSGGLLIAVASDAALQLEQALRERDLPVHKIGVAVERIDVDIELV